MFHPVVHWSRALGLTCLISLLAASCIFDADHRCGANQHLSDNSSCLCDDGLVLDAAQNCVPCGENEVWGSGVCGCVEGYTRDVNGTGLCIVSPIGTSCDLTASKSGCDTEPYTICRDHGEGAGYCTSACEGDSDCPHGYVCDTESSPASCKSAAVGQGDPCKTTADCVGKDADYCENTIAHLCIVVGCSMTNPLSCSEGLSCCDVHSLGLALTLCTPENLCPTAK